MPLAACGRPAPAPPPLAPAAAVIFSLVSLPTRSDSSTCERGRPGTLIGSLAESHAPTHFGGSYWLWHEPPTGPNPGRECQSSPSEFLIGWEVSEL